MNEINSEKILFLDPGTRHTGFAFWDEFDPAPGFPASAPIVTGVWRTKNNIPWERAVAKICACLDQFVIFMSVKQTVIEFPQMWAGSSKSITSASKGDLFKLCYLVGGLGEVARRECEDEPILVAPMEWKGQMPKKVVDRRIMKAIGRAYKDHESDAVGIGLAAQGKL